MCSVYETGPVCIGELMTPKENGRKRTRSVLKRLPEEIQIPDRPGISGTLLGTGVIEYVCEMCEKVWWMEENIATVCPICGRRFPKSRWTVPRVAFIPQT